MTPQEYVAQLVSFFGEVMDAHPDDRLGQKAKILADSVGAISPHAAGLDRRILDALGTIHAGLRQAEAWAQDRTRL